MSIGREFMDRTQYRKLGESDQQKGLPQPPLTQPVPEDAVLIDLPDPTAVGLPPVDLIDLMERRETLRRYADEPLTLAELSFLLWSTQGIKKVMEHSTRRTVPSAGARHAFETYLLINHVAGLAPGLYRYAALEHKIYTVKDAPDDIASQIRDASLDQRQITLSPATFIWVADFYRMKWRYQERGYRYLFLDAGHVCQNLYLAAEAINGGVCAIAAFDDDSLNAVLGLDGVDEFVVYLATVGKRK